MLFPIVCWSAVSDELGEVEFYSDCKSMGGWIAREPFAGGELYKVPCLTLDHFVQEKGIRVNFIKVDAAGNERSVLKGGHNLFKRDGPILICKLYHPDVVRCRFGYDVADIVDMLLAWDYSVFILENDCVIPIHVAGEALSLFRRHVYGLPLLAVKRDGQ